MSDKCFFRAQLFSQVVQKWHMVDPGLEFNLNMETGINTAKFPNTLNLEDAENKDRLDEAMRLACRILPPAQGRGDGAKLQKRLLGAATWGNAEDLKYLIRSCYVTERDALPALAEACSMGHVNCVEILLAAGVSACEPIPGSATEKNALHVACENGQEECARLLISSVKGMDEVNKTCKCPEDMTCFDLLRKNDMNGMARRLEAHANSVFSKDGA